MWMGWGVIFFATSGKAIRSTIGKDAQHNSQRAVRALWVLLDYVHTNYYYSLHFKMLTFSFGLKTVVQIATH